MMIVLEHLIGLYEKKGYTVRTGLNPFHFNNWRDAPFTALFKDGKIMHTGGGISVQELFFFEILAKVYEPSRIFIIGNAFGWSTLALSLIFNKSIVVALDKGIEGAGNQAGNCLTNTIAREEGLNCQVMLGSSPQDIGRAVGALGGLIDFALVDGLHTNDQQLHDYLGLKEYLSPSNVIVFHDVINFNMIESFRMIEKDWKGKSEILLRTPSGMGLCYTEDLQTTIGRVVRIFTDSTVHLISQ